MLTQNELLLYLERIGLSSLGEASQTRLQGNRSLEANLDLLREVQKHHLLSIPYENLSLHWRPIRVDAANVGHTATAKSSSAEQPEFLSPPFGLSKDDLMRKLVVQRRGGYCLELNSLLGEALEVLGFSVERATAKIVRGSSLLSKQLAREKNSDLNESDIHELEVFPHDESGWETHQMLLVGVPASSESVRYEKYLVDAGLAKYSILEPIALSSTLADEGHHQYQGALGKRFRIAPAVDQATETESGRRWNLSVKFPGSRIWFPYYTFKAQEASAQQIDMIHYYMSMTPSSTRPAEPFATMPTCDGERQVTLQGLTLTIEQIEGGTEKERVVEVTTLKNEEEQREYFQRYFGIEGYQAGTVLVKAT